MRTLLPGRDPESVTPAELDAAIEAALGAVPVPAAIAVPGWHSKGARALLRWAVRHEVPAVLMSDSTAQDAPRRWHKELVKRRILRCFGAALVAGRPQGRYLAGLGFPKDRIFAGYDVVDNAHFARGAAAVRRPGRAPLFLACGRFVAKKGFPTLLEAYAAYREAAGPTAWRLAILGDGPLRPELEAMIARLGLAAHVDLPGFVQYEGLPGWYGRAGAFVLPSVSEQWGLVVNEAMAAGLPVLVSRRCGCVADLVAPGRNGFTFAAGDVPGLASLLQRVAHGGLDLDAMGAASRAIVAEWGLPRFVAGLKAAVAAARRPKARAPGLLERGLLLGLARA